MPVLGLAACADGLTAPREAGLSGDVFGLPVLEVPSCRYGGDYPACNPGPGPEGTGPSTEEPSAPGGGAPGAEPDTSKTPPCQTDDPALNDAKVQAGLEALWDGSNPEAAAVGDRRERFAWIIQTPTGYELRDMGVVGTFCGIDADVLPPAEGKAAVVGWVHTHPYHDREWVLTCGASQSSINGYNQYTSAPSSFDRSTSRQLSDFIGKSNLPAYVIDSKAITRFGTDRRNDRRHDRCGY